MQSRRKHNLRATDPDLRRAMGLFRAFREEKADRIRSIKFQVPRAMARIGTCEFLGYVTTHRSKPALYVHYFAPGSRPGIYGNTGRGQCYFLGGRYKLGVGGFTDLDARGRIVDFKPRFRVFQVDSKGRIILGPHDEVIRSSSRSRMDG